MRGKRGEGDPARTHVATNYRALSRLSPSRSPPPPPPPPRERATPRVVTLPSNYLTGASRIVNCGRINRIGESHLSRRAMTKTSAGGEESSSILAGIDRQFREDRRSLFASWPIVY